MMYIMYWGSYCWPRGVHCAHICVLCTVLSVLHHWLHNQDLPIR